MKFIKLALVVMLVMTSLVQGMELATARALDCIQAQRLHTIKSIKAKIKSLDSFKELEQQHTIDIACHFPYKSYYKIAITLYDKESIRLGQIVLSINPIYKSGTYDYLNITFHARGKGLAQKLIALGMNIMATYNIKHRKWDALPQDPTTHLERLESLYKRYGGKTIAKSTSYASMQWSAPQTTTPQRQLRSSL